MTTALCLIPMYPWSQTSTLRMSATSSINTPEQIFETSNSPSAQKTERKLLLLSSVIRKFRSFLQRSEHTKSMLKNRRPHSHKEPFISDTLGKASQEILKIFGCM